MRKLVIVLVIAAAALAAWKLLPGNTMAAKATPDSEERLITRAEKRDIAYSVEVSGDVTPAFSLEVKSEVGGKLKALHVEPGQSVTAGELLVEIDDRDLLTEKESVLTEIEGAKLSMEKSKRNFERSKELFESKLISREVFDNLSSEFAIAENGLVRAQRRLQLVEDKLRKTKVIAPSEGTVLTVPVTEGQVVIAAASVNSGTTLMTLANLSQLRVETHVNQVDVAKLELNQKVKLRAESLRDLEMEATISRIAFVATPKASVKGFEVQAIIENPNPRLRPGMTVNMSIPIASANDAVAVPISAIFKGENNARVIYVKNGDMTEKREVKVGVSNIDHVQILNGVTEGEEILLVEPDRSPGASQQGKRS
jgi:RND family efflux transporter MFP subunit